MDFAELQQSAFCISGRVEDWRASVGEPSLRFQSPPHRTQRAELSHCALMYGSHQGL
jgi:hypothetical protein